MTSRSGPARPARTVLEAMIRERQQTLEEFANYIETFRREHNERGTLSLRHLERLVSGHRGDGSPLGPLRPATARLLEHIFGLNISDLLSPPDSAPEDDTATELRQRLNASRRVDAAVIALLRSQVEALRHLDRRLGAIVAYGEVTTKAAQVAALHSCSLSPAIRSALAALMAEIYALAGWQALDRAEISQAWDHHDHAMAAAREADSPIRFAHALAQQAVVLLDLGETTAALHQFDAARCIARKSGPRLMRSWLAAAHGEGLARAGRHAEALDAFDRADVLLPLDPIDPELPFLFLGGTHLVRWRSHALVELDEPEAVPSLADVLANMDPSFTRATTAVHIDFAIALISAGEFGKARIHIANAAQLSGEIGSVRHLRKAGTLQDLI